MKTATPRALVALLIALAVAAPAAAQEHPAPEDAAPAPHAADGVLAVAKADGRFSRFLAAVEAAGLDAKLAGKGPFTVFAPTDAAFAKLPEGTLDDLMKPANQARLAGLLANHVVPGKLAADAFKTMKATNVAGHDLAIVVGDDGATVDGAHVVGKELVAANGVVHAIDSVLAPTGNGGPAPTDKPKDHPAH